MGDEKDVESENDNKDGVGEMEDAPEVAGAELRAVMETEEEVRLGKN